MVRTQIEDDQREPSEKERTNLKQSKDTSHQIKEKKITHLRLAKPSLFLRVQQFG